MSEEMIFELNENNVFPTLFVLGFALKID